MEIITVKHTQENQGYLLNGTLSVPMAEGNRHYQIIQEWIADGGVVEPFETAEETQARLDAEHNAQVKQELDELDKQSIRDIREWIASQPNTPQTLKDRETQAIEARGRFK